MSCSSQSPIDPATQRIILKIVGFKISVGFDQKEKVTFQFYNRNNNLSAKEICMQQFFASSRHLVLGSQNYTEKKMFIKSNKVETLQHMQKIEKVSAQFLGKSESLESTSMINGLSKRPWCCHQTKTCVFSVRPRSFKQLIGRFQRMLFVVMFFTGFKSPPEEMHKPDYSVTFFGFFHMYDLGVSFTFNFHKEIQNHP